MLNIYEEHPDYGNFVKEIEHKRFKGKLLYKRGNMCFVLDKNGALIDKCHVEDIRVMFFGK